MGPMAAVTSVAAVWGRELELTFVELGLDPFAQDLAFDESAPFA